MIIKKENSDYSELLRSTTIFGGVQLYNILIKILKSKVLAVLLGPNGIGILSLLQSTTGLIESLTNFGIGRVAIKDVAENKGDIFKQTKTIKVIELLVYFSGLLGAINLFFFSEKISLLTFKTSNYTTEFRWLSSILFINQLFVCKNVIMQGFRERKLLALSNLIGNSISLIFSIPIYIFYREDGIVPALIIHSLMLYITSLIFSNKIKLPHVKIVWDEFLAKAKPIIRMGASVSIASILTLASSYLLRIIILNSDGINQVGLYSAGTTILTTYFGLVFAAMTTDFYPKLSAAMKKPESCYKLINLQAEIAVLILSPLILILVGYSNLIIPIIFSKDFVSISPMIIWGSVGIIFKAISWSMGISLMASGVVKDYLLNEIITILYSFLLGFLGYKIYGLTGFGLAYCLTYILHLVQMTIFLRIKINFQIEKRLIKIASLQMILIALTVTINYLFAENYKFIIATLFLVMSLYFSTYQLKSKM
jgi:O-antigen/teichoic acid export membrane protein